MRCGCEVPWMILLRVCLYTLSFKVLTLSTYALSPVMLALLEPFLELLL
jgi:hypothetical protein